MPASSDSNWMNHVVLMSGRIATGCGPSSNRARTSCAPTNPNTQANEDEGHARHGWMLQHEQQCVCVCVGTQPYLDGSRLGNRISQDQRAPATVRACYTSRKRTRVVHLVGHRREEARQVGQRHGHLTGSVSSAPWRMGLYICSTISSYASG